MKLREATPADADLIARLHTESWRSAYRAILDPTYLSLRVEVDRQTTWAARLGARSPDCKVLIAEAEGQAAGFVCALGQAGARWGTLVDNLHVRPALKRRGTGLLLLRAAADWARTTYPHAGLYLWCFAENEAARRFYAAQGGRVVEREMHPTFGAAPRPALRFHWTDLRTLLGPPATELRDGSE